MSAFEDFVNLELPKRPPMLTLANTGYDGDPNAGGAPVVVQNSPQGTFFFRTTGNILYTKNTSAPGAWAAVGSGGGGSANAVTKTTAALALYMATTGSDANDGLTIGTPLLTLTAALGKVPFLVQSGHPVTINMAAGTYNEHVICPAFILQDNITVQGSPMVATAPGTGITSGTFNVAFGTQAFPHRAVVTGAGWTAGGLTGGFYVEMTGGPNIGAQYPITNNGIDTIDVAFPCGTGQTINLQGQTFTLMKPTTILTRSTSSDSLVSVQLPVFGSTATGALPQNTLSAYLVFSKIAFQRTAAFSGQTCLLINAGAYVRANNCSFLDAGSGGGVMITGAAQSVIRLDDCLTYRAALRTNTSHVSLNFSTFVANRYASHGGNFAVFAITSSAITVSSGFFYGQDVAAAIGNQTRGFLSNVGIDAPFGGAQVTDWGLLQLSRVTIKNCLTFGAAVGFSGFGGSFSTSAVSGATLILTGFSSVGTIIDNCVLGLIIGANSTVNVLIQSDISNNTAYGINMGATLRSGHNTLTVNPLMTMAGNAVDITLDGTTPSTLAFLRAQVPKQLTSINTFNRIVEV